MERDQKLAFAVSAVGLALVVAGYFGPWVPHRTAALTVTGFELSWFAKFFPQVQGEAVPVMRYMFFTPPIAAAILLSLAAQRSIIRPVVRLGVTGLAVLLVLAALPPYDSFLAAEYREQLVLAIVGMVLILLTALAYRLPRPVYGILCALLALAGAVPALWQFALLRPLVIALYGQSLGLGWGMAVCSAGFLLLLGCGLFTALKSSRSV